MLRISSGESAQARFARVPTGGVWNVAASIVRSERRGKAAVPANVWLMG
jgi:hypothetical protein